MPVRFVENHRSESFVVRSRMEADIICKDSDPQWKVERSKYVCASELGAMLNESPWSDRATLLREKRMAQGGVFKEYETKNTWWGKSEETHNGILFGNLLGYPYGKDGLFRVRGMLGATIDGFYSLPRAEYYTRPKWFEEEAKWWLSDFDSGLPDSGTIYCELKQTEIFSLKEWKKGVPKHYELQVQGQMLVLGVDRMAVLCKLGSSTTAGYVVREDKFMQKVIQEEVEKFMQEL